jgi:hypothetical protein
MTPGLGIAPWIALQLVPLACASVSQSSGGLPANLRHDDVPLVGSLFGISIATLDDLDGDDFPDLIVGDPLQDRTDPRDPGDAWVLSGKDGAVLRRWTGDTSGDAFGNVVAAPGDLDGDEVPDVLVAATPYSRTEPRAGYIRAFSGKDERTLQTIRVPPPEGRARVSLYLALSGLGDLDGDGCAEFGYGANQEGLDWHEPGSVHIVSGKSGKELFRWGPDAEVEWLGEQLCGFRDLDGDGVRDVIVLAGAENGIRFRVYSGRTGELLREYKPPELQGGYVHPASMSLTPDLDGDGIEDLLVGKVRGDAGSAVHAISGKTGAWIRSWKRRSTWAFGTVICGVGDVDRDAIPDVLVTDPETSSEVSSVWVLRGGKDERIWEWHTGPMTSSAFGVSACVLGDRDGDGVKDVAVGEATWRGAGSFDGLVRIFSARTGELIDQWGRPAVKPKSR